VLGDAHNEQYPILPPVGNFGEQSSRLQADSV